MTTLAETTVASDHANCSVAKCLDLIELALAPKKKGRFSFLSIKDIAAIGCSGGANVYAEIQQVEAAKKQKQSTLKTQLEQIKSVDCHQECWNCVWGARLEDPNNALAALMVGEMLKLDEDQLDIATTKAIIEKE
jgi:hypothetical protein